MKINDRVYVHGYVDEIRKDTVIIRNEGGYFGTVKSEIVEAQKTEDIVSVIRCKDCEHWNGDDDETFCSELGIFGTDPNSFCSYARKKEEPTMEEVMQFMQGQDLGDPEDGRL